MQHLLEREWAHHHAVLNDARPVTLDLVDVLMEDELARLRWELGDARFAAGKFTAARDLFQQMTAADEIPDFLTSVAYEQL